VDPSTGHYVDEFGRTRIFHGMNVVVKHAPWIPQSQTFNTVDSLDAETMDNLRKWGFNVVRLGVMWPGVEPVLHQLDQPYLQEIVQLTERLAERGVYTIADFHQDVGSRRFCGEGFPEHYIDALLQNKSSMLARAPAFPAPSVKASELPMNASGYPSLEDCKKREFAQYYLTYAVGAMWEEMYTPGTELQKGFLRYWSAVGTAFRDAPQLLGYELINEPPGYCLGGTRADCLKSPEIILDNAVETHKLMPLYQLAGKAIRATGAKQHILYEATVPPKLTAQVFPELPLGNDTQQGLAYHIYCAPGDGAGPVAGLVCKGFLDLYYNTYYPFLRKYNGVAGFMTEFGAVGGNPLELKHLDMLLNVADDHLQSWAYWMLKLYGDFTTANSAESLYDADGKLETAKLKILSRTYGQAIAGTPQRMTFDTKTGAFQLDFNATVTAAPTEIYLNEELHYPNGYVLEIQPSTCAMRQSSETNYIYLTLPLESPCKDTLVKIQITAKGTAPTPLASLMV